MKIWFLHLLKYLVINTKNQPNLTKVYIHNSFHLCSKISHISSFYLPSIYWHAQPDLGCSAGIEPGPAQCQVSTYQLSYIQGPFLKAQYQKMYLTRAPPIISLVNGISIQLPSVDFHILDRSLDNKFFTTEKDNY